MILLIDNYDSFSYNLVQLAGSIRPDIRVIRNDTVRAEEIGKMAPDHLILSPGPGYPKDAGICEEVVRTYAGKIPILGVCLGHQAICEAFGAVIGHAGCLMHGKQSRIRIHTETPIFAGLPEQLDVARYHSLAALRDTLPDCLEVIGEEEESKEIMAVQHRDYPVYGLQFHPESILTPLGRSMMEEFLKL